MTAAVATSVPEEAAWNPRLAILLAMATFVPLIADFVGLVISFQMVRLPDIKPAASLEGVLGA
jgi:hypothetical protein